MSYSHTVRHRFSNAAMLLRQTGCLSLWHDTVKLRYVLYAVPTSDIMFIKGIILTTKKVSTLRSKMMIKVTLYMEDSLHPGFKVEAQSLQFTVRSLTEDYEFEWSLFDRKKVRACGGDIGVDIRFLDELECEEAVAITEGYVDEDGDVQPLTSDVARAYCPSAQEIQDEINSWCPHYREDRKKQEAANAADPQDSYETMADEARGDIRESLETFLMD